MSIYKLCAAVIISGVIASPALADGDKNIEIRAEVLSSCQFSALSGGGIDPSQPIVLGVAATGVHAGVAEANSGTTRAMHLSCNQPFVVHLESDQGAVRRLSLANGGDAVDTPILGGSMAKAIGYSASPRLVDVDTALFTPSYSTLTANADLLLGAAPATKLKALNVVRTDASGENSGGAYDGTLEIGIATETSSMLVSGSYRDTLRVILIAQ